MKVGPARAMMLLALVGLAACAPVRKSKAPPPPTGELSLDMNDPVIDVRIGNVPLRLRVALNQKRLIELNPSAAERLRNDPPDRRFHFESGLETFVGREILKGIEASAPITLNDRKMLVTVASHGRDCCAGVDGEIGIGLLPYAIIRFNRAQAPPPVRTAAFLIDDHDEHGPQASVQLGRETVFLQFSLERVDSVATASAGVILARAYGGRLGEGGSIVAAFGVERPTTMLGFPKPIAIGGFTYARLPVRTADFGGKYSFPTDPGEPGDIEVRRKVVPQDPWPVILIGQDRLGACAEISFDAISRTLTLRCSAGDPA